MLDPSNQVAKRGLARLSLEHYQADADQPFDQTISQLYVEALREMRKERFVEALAKLEEGLKLNPTQIQVKRLKAEVETQALIQAGERDAAALCEAGRSLLAENSYLEAKGAFERALGVDPSADCAKQGLQAHASAAKPYASGLNEKALKLEKLGLHDQAEGLFAQVLDLFPDTKSAQEGLKRAASNSRNLKQQGKLQEEARQWYNQGVEAWEAGRLADAASAFKQVLQRQPDDKEADLALTKVQQRLDTQLSKYAQEAVRLYEKGKELEERGQLEEAHASYQKAAARDSTYGAALEAAARLEAELK